MSNRECREFVTVANLYLQRKGSIDGDPHVRMGIRTTKAIIYVLDDPPEQETINIYRLI